MSTKNINPPRGMRDILPSEMRLRSQLLETVLHTYKKYGFTQIETPAVEDLKFLTKDASDNSKLIFALLKRGEELTRALQSGDYSALGDLGLRYDLTIPLARFYSSNRATLPSVFKSIQIGPVWRAERPQKGRYRQFYQCDIDILGCSSIYNELELLAVSSRTLVNLGLKGFKININDRRILTALLEFCQLPKALHNSVLITLDKLDKIGIEGVEKELQALSVTEFNLQKLIEIISTPDLSIATLKEYLKNHVEPKIFDDLDFIVRQINQGSNEEYTCLFNLNLVRGMGYYTGLIYEITYKDYSFSIAGGGRYDHMIEDIINISVPACGISLGFERLVVILSEEQMLKPNTTDTIAIIYDSQANQENLMQQINALWQSERPITLYQRKKNFTKQLNEILDMGITEYIIADREGNLSDLKMINNK